jgi:hypothetical protein
MSLTLLSQDELDQVSGGAVIDLQPLLDNLLGGNSLLGGLINALLGPNSLLGNLLRVVSGLLTGLLGGAL